VRPTGVHGRGLPWSRREGRRAIRIGRSERVAHDSRRAERRPQDRTRAGQAGRGTLRVETPEHGPAIRLTPHSGGRAEFGSIVDDNSDAHQLYQRILSARFLGEPARPCGGRCAGRAGAPLRRAPGRDDARTGWLGAWGVARTPATQHIPVIVCTSCPRPTWPSPWGPRVPAQATRTGLAVGRPRPLRHSCGLIWRQRQSSAVGSTGRGVALPPLNYGRNLGAK
jgi:hypothetical protein